MSCVFLILNRCMKQKRKINKYFYNIQIYEYKYEQLVVKLVEFFLFIKIKGFFQMKDSFNFKYYIKLFLISEIFDYDDFMELLSKI